MKHKTLLGALLCAVAAFAHAENNSFDEVVVTASRSEQRLNQTLQSTSVITQSDIAASGATDVLALLKNQAGVEITQNGGMGTTSSLYLRGTNSTHTLVLIDGGRVGSATAGGTAIEHLMLDNIERIEIVRGNVSSLYGSEAIGGVVQIFTKRGTGEPKGRVSAGYGTHNTRKLAVNYGGALNDFSFDIGAAKLATDGVSSINPVIAPSANPDKDGYDNVTLSNRLGYAFNAEHRVELSAFQTQGKSQYDSSRGAPTDTHRSDNRLAQWQVTSHNAFAANWQSRVTLGQGTDDSTNYTNNLKSGLYKTTSDQLGWQNTVLMGEHGVLLLGAERLKQKVKSDTLFSVQSRTANSVFAGYSADYSVHQVQANVRQDRYSDVGSSNSALLAYGLRVNDALRLTVSTSTAFKAPTFNDMYWPSSFGYQGNPNLKPERAKSVEAGLHYAKDGAYLDATAFGNRISNLIVINNSFTTMANLDEAVIEGVDLVYGVKHDGIEVQNALTLQNPRNAKTGKPLAHRAQTLNTLTVARHFEGVRFGFEWRSSGERNDTDMATFSPTTLPAYDVINLSAQWKLTPQLELNARVDNLFGQDYMLVHGYNTLGRTVFIGLSAHQ
jgi:vitamin B12 transporter